MWFQILRIHPEFQVDANGKQIKLERNHNLRHKLLPAQHADLDSCVTSTISCGGIINCIGLNDRLLAVSSMDGACFCSCPLRTEDYVINDASTAPPIAYAVTGSSFFIIRAWKPLPTSAIVQDIPNALPNTLRMVVLGVDLFTETVTPEAAAAAAKKAGGAKKGAPQDFWKPKRVLKYRLQVLDLFASAHPSDRSDARYEKIHDIHFECPFAYDSLDYLHALYDHLRISLSEDGCLMSLVVNDAQAACRVYELSTPKDHVFRQIAEEKEEELLDPPAKVAAVADVPAVLKTPVIVAQWAVANTAGPYIKAIVSELNFLSSDSTTLASVSPPGADFPSFVPLRPERYPAVRLSMILAGSPFLIKLRLKLKPQEPAKDPKKPDAAKGKGVEIVVPPPVPCEVYEQLRWNLSHAVTCTAYFRDEDTTEYVVIGQADGLLSLWNVSKDQLVSTLGRHPAAITAIATYYNPSSKTMNIVSGAAGGTVTYYNNASDGWASPDLGSLALVDFRQDVFNDAVISIKYLPNAINSSGTMMDGVTVQYASDLLVLHSLPDLGIVSAFSENERVNYQDVTSIHMASANVPLRYFVPIPIDVPPPVEVVVDPKAKNAPLVEEVKHEVTEPVPPPPLVVEKNLAKQVIIAELVRSGCSLLRYQAYSACVDGRALHLVLHSFRHDSFVLSWFNITKAMEEALRCLGKSSSAKSIPHIASQSLFESSVISRKASRAGMNKGGGKLKDIHQLSSKTMKLTEERLEAHQRELEGKDLQNSLSTLRTSSLGLDGFGTSSRKHLDPIAEVKADLMDSKRRRERSKGQLSKTLRTLTSMC